MHIFLRHFSHQHFRQSPTYYAEFLTRSFWRFPLASCSPLSPYYFLNVFRGLTLLCSSIFAGCLLLSCLDVIRVPSHQIELVPCLKADHVKTQNYCFRRKALLDEFIQRPLHRTHTQPAPLPGVHCSGSNGIRPDNRAKPFAPSR